MRNPQVKQYFSIWHGPHSHTLPRALCCPTLLQFPSNNTLTLPTLPSPLLRPTLPIRNPNTHLPPRPLPLLPPREERSAEATIFFILTIFLSQQILKLKCIQMKSVKLACGSHNFHSVADFLLSYSALQYLYRTFVVRPNKNRSS